MENYAQAKHKETGELGLLNLEKDIEKMDIYELIPDPDLNRSLKHYVSVLFSYLKDFCQEKLKIINNLFVG